MEANLINLSFYRFFRLERLHGDLRILSARLRPILEGLKLQGKIILAPEGINAMVSGTRESVDRLKDFAAAEFGLEASSFKEAPIGRHSFNRLLIKVKKEIITIGNIEVRPDEQTGKRLPPAKLREWLDEGRPLVLLDARNGYEFEVGSFQGACEMGMDHSREFAQKAAELVEQYKDQTIVTFCTGGIRCEKGSALLLNLGFKDVYQLDGGILRYLEENGSAHFKGNCFVFDWRMAVDGGLKPVARSADSQDEHGRHQKNRMKKPLPLG